MLASDPLRNPGVRHRPIMVATSVIAGLVLSSAAGVFLMAEPAGRLPGVALGSETILVCERIAVLFAGWLATLVVISRALTGDLPIEVSGRGVRYADLEISQSELLNSRHAARDLDRQIEALVEAVVAVEQTQSEQAESLRRYAMQGGSHGH